MPPFDDDYSNHIPDAVRRASERADELARTVGAANAPEEDGLPVEPVDPAPSVPAPEPPAELVSEWEQRYRTLKGKYDSEIGQLRGQVGSLESLLANIRETPPIPTAHSPSVDPPLIPKEDVEAFGEDLIAAARRWAMTEFQPHVTRLEGEIKRLNTGQSTIQQETAQQRVMSTLDADPDLSGTWRETNTNPDFIAWLNQVDPFSGQQRMQLLSDAYGRGDAVRTANFFKAFIAEHTATSQSTLPAPAHTSDLGADRVSLESLAAPGRPTASVPSGAPVEKRIWSNRQIASFYRDVQRGVYATDEARKLRTEQDIFDAASEGRIRS